MSPLLEVTEDTPPDMLAGSMDLRLVIPDGRRVRMSVDRRTPMMDLLVQVTTAYKISPAGYVLQPYGETGLLPYKPSTPIGALDTWIVHIVPKNQSLQNPSNKINLKQIIPPFEQTLRFQVNLPRNQLYVTRVSGRCSMRDILHQACSEKNLDPSKYTLRHPKQLDKPLCDELSIAEYGHNQVTMLSIKNLPTAVLTEDILQMNKYKVQSDSDSGSGASSISPLVPVQPSKPLRKRRPAPKPPVQQRKEQSQKQQSETIICHSRTSSDSSGYHEASVLSESPDSNNSSLPDSLPRRSKLSTIETNSSREANKLSRSLSNLHQASTSAPSKSNLKPAQSVSCLAPSRKKKPAPPPPIAIAEEKEEKSATLPSSSRLMASTEERIETPVNKKPAPIRAPSPVNTVDLTKEIISPKTIPPINCFSSSPSKTVEKLSPSQPVAKLLKNFESTLNFSNNRQTFSENPSIPVGHVKSLSEKFVLLSDKKPVIDKVKLQMKFPYNKPEIGFTSENNHLFKQSNFGRTMKKFSECSFTSIPDSLSSRKSSCVSDSVSPIPPNLMEELEARIAGKTNNVKMILKQFEKVNTACNDESESSRTFRTPDKREYFNPSNKTFSKNDQNSQRLGEYSTRYPYCEEKEELFLDEKKGHDMCEILPDQFHIESDNTPLDYDLPNEKFKSVKNSPSVECSYLRDRQSFVTVCHSGTHCSDDENDSLSDSSNSFDGDMNLGNSVNAIGLCNEKDKSCEEEPEVIWKADSDLNCALPNEESVTKTSFCTVNNLKLGRRYLDVNLSEAYEAISITNNHNQSNNDFKSDFKEDEIVKIIKPGLNYVSDSDSNSDTSDSLPQLPASSSSVLKPNPYETSKYLKKHNDSPIRYSANLELKNSPNNIVTTQNNNYICDNKSEFDLNLKTTTPPILPCTIPESDISNMPKENIIQGIMNYKIDDRRESLFSNGSAIYESMESIQQKIQENKIPSKEINSKQKSKTVTFCEPKRELDSISENGSLKPSKRDKPRFSSPLKLGLWTQRGKALLFGKKKKPLEQSWTHVDSFSFCDCPNPDVVYIRVPDTLENEKSRIKRNESPISDNSDHTYMAMNGTKASTFEVAYEMSESELVHKKISELLDSRPDEFL